MSEKAEAVVYLLIGIPFSLMLPIAAWVTFGTDWYGLGLIGLFLLAFLWMLGGVGVWSISEGYGRVKA